MKMRYFKKFLWQIYHWSGARYIWISKVNPIDKTTGARRPSTIILWGIGVYLAAFGVASNRYENHIDRIENRITAIYSQLSSNRSAAFSRVGNVQKLEAPYRPELFKPISVIKSFAVNHRYEEGVQELKELVEDWAKETEPIDVRLKSGLGSGYWLEYFSETIDVNSFGDPSDPYSEFRRVTMTVSRKEIEKRKVVGLLAGLDLGYAFLDDGVNLIDAYLEHVDLRYTRMYDSYLSGSHLEHANLQNAFLMDSKFVLAHLEHADLRYAHLDNTNFGGAFLQYAKLSDVEAYFTDFSGANLQHVSMFDSKFYYADFSGADFQHVRLEGTIFDNSCLCGVDFKGVEGLSYEQLSKVFSLYGVKNLDQDLEREINEKSPHLFQERPEVLWCSDEYVGKGFLKYLENVEE